MLRCCIAVACFMSLAVQSANAQPPSEQEATAIKAGLADLQAAVAELKQKTRP